jgi:hypothetical protein
MGIFIKGENMKEYPTQEYLNSVLEYRDGKLYWKVDNGKKFAGDQAGTYVKSTGYRTIGINYEIYPEHRLIWIMFNGNVSNDIYIDHINMTRDDNRIENLRLLTHAQNLFNNKAKNIYVRKTKAKPFEAYIGTGKNRITKSFHTEQEASEWVAQKKSEIFQE